MKHLNNTNNESIANHMNENLVTKVELAAKTSCSVSYINKLIKLKRITPIKIGRSVRFRYSQVLLELERWSLV